MKIIGLEEHFVTRDVLAAWAAAGGDTGLGFGSADTQEQLLDFGDRRRADMADMGVDVQVLSLTSPGVQELDAATAVPLARDANDIAAAAAQRDPEHFQVFATLPTPDPAAAAEELRRAVVELGCRGALVNGRTGDRGAEHRDFDDLYSVAAQLHAPIYLHPQLPVAPVRSAYYDGYDEKLSALFAGPGIGWHYETGVQLLRMVLGGVFDRHPDLQVIVGHWGEVVLFYLDRIGFMEGALALERPLADYFRTNVSYTGSGILSQRYLRWAIEVVGIDRIMYAADYPYVPAVRGGAAREFLKSADLTEQEKAAVGSGNWERLTAATAPAGGNG